MHAPRAWRRQPRCRPDPPCAAPRADRKRTRARTDRRRARPPRAAPGIHRRPQPYAEMARGHRCAGRKSAKPQSPGDPGGDNSRARRINVPHASSSVATYEAISARCVPRLPREALRSLLEETREIVPIAQGEFPERGSLHNQRCSVSSGDRNPSPTGSTGAAAWPGWHTSLTIEPTTRLWLSTSRGPTASIVAE